MIDFIIEEIESRIKKLGDVILSFNMLGNERGIQNARNRQNELESTLRFIRQVAADVTDAPAPNGSARVWMENGVIKCMSQMCEVNGVKCPHFDDCDTVDFDIEEIHGTDEGGDI